MAVLQRLINRIKIICPFQEDDPKNYFNSKGFHSISLQACCDASYHFLCIFSKCVGLIHDALVHALSGVGEYLEQGKLNLEFYNVGTDACASSYGVLRATQNMSYSSAMQNCSSHSRLTVLRHFF